MPPTLYIVATPIGNLEDITMRALRVLKECDAILCEDTRVTRKLLTHYGIETSTISYHEYSGPAKYEKVRALLLEGKTLALVTDAGTPGISDPGAQLVEHVRSTLPAVRIESVPGPSALVAAFSVSGIVSTSFHFYGFPPHKKGRKTFFEQVAKSECPVAFYESPHRLVKALESLTTVLPAVRKVYVCRELTKLHEEVVSGSAAEVHMHFLQHPDTVRGECVILVA